MSIAIISEVKLQLQRNPSNVLVSLVFFLKISLFQVYVFLALLCMELAFQT